METVVADQLGDATIRVEARGRDGAWQVHSI